MKIALAQMSVSSDKAENMGKISMLVGQAADQRADLVVFPEASMFNFGQPTDQLAPYAEPIDGQFVTWLKELASINGVWILAGMFESSIHPDKVYNTLVLVTNRGELKETYRKIHLFNAFGWSESDRIISGDGATMVFQLANMTIGAMTCYDLRFPELARHLAYQGAEAIILPAAWVAGPLKESQLEVLLRARAIENHLYMACAVQVENGFTGSSMVVDPMGVIQASRGELEGVLISELVLERVHSVRATSPTLKNRRMDVYEKWGQTKWYE